MSGPLEVIGGLSSLITIVETTQRLYEQLKQDVNLPATYQQVSPKLALWSSALEHCQQDARTASLSDNDKANCMALVQNCEDEIDSLRMIFESVIVQPADKRRVQFQKKWQRFNKGKKVNKVLLDVNDRIAALVNYRVLTDVRPDISSSVMYELKSLGQQLSDLQDYAPEDNGKAPIISNHADTQQGFFGQNTGGSTAFGYVANVNHYTVLPPRGPLPAPTMVDCPIQDPNFVDRGALKKLLTIWTDVPRTAIVGLGGTGKSALALQFAYLVHEESPDRWVFWVRASSLLRFAESYRYIAMAMQIPDYDRAQDDLLTVKSWLSNKANGKWLMIVDNADDSSVFYGDQAAASEKGSMSPSSLLPTGSHGAIILISRDRGIAKSFVSRANILEIGVMTAAEALELMKKRIPTITAHCDGSVERLAKGLDYIPLAMTQALAYMQNCEPHISASGYLRILSESDDQKAELLGTAMADPWREGCSSNAPLTTWKISFDAVNRNRPSAASLLSLMSMFDCHSIPTLPRKTYDALVNKGMLDPCHGLDFTSDITVLQDFGLVEAVMPRNQYRMHGIVQLATTCWLRSRGELEHWQDVYVTTLYNLLPEVTDRDFNQWQSLIPHTLRTTSFNPHDVSTKSELERLLDRISDFCTNQNFLPPLEAFTKSLKRLVSENNSSSSEYMTMLEVRRWYALMVSRKLDQVVESSKKLAEEMEREYGEEDHKTILFWSLYALYLSYFAQDHAKAEYIAIKSLEHARSLVPKNGGCLMYCTMCLSGVYVATNRYAETEILYEEVQEYVNSEDNGMPGLFWSIFQSLHVMALVNIGRYSEATDFVDKQIDLSVLKYDPESMTTMRISLIGGVAYMMKGFNDLGDLNDEDLAAAVVSGRAASSSIVYAAQLFERNMHIPESRTSGPFVYKATAMSGLAMCYLYLNQLSLALQLQAEAIQWCMEHGGESHHSYQQACDTNELLLEFRDLLLSASTPSKVKVHETVVASATPTTSTEKKHGIRHAFHVMHSLMHTPHHRNHRRKKHPGSRRIF